MGGVFNMILRMAMQRILQIGVNRATNAYARHSADASSRGPRTAAVAKQQQEAFRRARLATRLARIRF